MRVLILTLGTRGDVQPYVALGEELIRRGHEVGLATSASFEAMVASRGIRFYPLADDLVVFAQSAEGRAVMDPRGGWLKRLRAILRAKRAFAAVRARWLAGQADAARDFRPDLLVGHLKAQATDTLAEVLDIPWVCAMPLPVLTPTATTSCIMLPFSLPGAWGNRLSYRLARRLIDLQDGLVNRWRADAFGLPPRRSSRALKIDHRGRPVRELLALSPHVLPPPPDWPPTTTLTGYWFPDPDPAWLPPADLAHFLEAGPPPVYAGFGSISGHDPAASARTVAEALRGAGQRGILASGWGGLDTADVAGDDLFLLEEAPHDWLLPRCAAVVHHGGAGSTAAGLRAGRPTVICPFFADQPFWARRVEALGVGPAGIPQRHLTVERLTEAIVRACGDEAMRAKAEEFGRKIRAEDGRAVAVKALEEIHAAPW